MPKAKSSKIVRSAESFGAFMPDGSYFADATIQQRGPADGFVRAMIASRRGPAFSTALAAEAITLTKQDHAFPNRAQWSSIAEQVDEGAAVWPFLRTSTVAEEAVKRCGLAILNPANGEERHWCGEQWIAGAEKNCESLGHRQEQDLDRVRAMVARVVAKFSDPATGRKGKP